MKNNIQIAIGYWISNNPNLDKIRLNNLYRYKNYVYDLHFAHYNPNIVSSGRFKGCDKDKLFNFIEFNNTHHNFNLTLLMNYLLHNDYNMVLKNFQEEFYSRGIRSVVIADIELIKRMKQRFPDVTIQGSCLSYRMTEDELYDEAKEGVEIHNPAIDIIRDYKQLIKNSQAGFKQKVIFGEGCLRNCPHERYYKGHRWSIARNLDWSHPTMCINLIRYDLKHFFLANWVTLERLKELEPYIDVIKLPRKNLQVNGNDVASYPVDNTYLDELSTFLERYNGKEYNVLDYIGVSHVEYLRKRFRKVPSTYFNSEFFKTTAYCNMKCEENNCRICHQIEKRLYRNYKQGGYHL